MRSLCKTLTLDRWSNQIETGFSGPSPTALITSSVTLVERGGRKRKKDLKRVIERPIDAPSFVNLYKELLSFGGGFGSVGNVIGVVDSLLDSLRGEGGRGADEESRTK